MFAAHHNNVPIKDSRLLEHIAQVDVCVEEVRIQLHRLLEVMYGEPYFALRVEHTAEIRPRDSELRLRLNRFQVARLHACMSSSHASEFSTGPRWPQCIII